MENNQPLFDIFEFLGIEITDNLERVQKAIDALPAAKMAELRKKPEFSSMRKFLYTKKASNEFLSYVQDIRDLKDPAKQEKLRQEQLRQQQEQLQQQERQRQEQIRQQQERQRQEQIRQQQERQRQEQIRQQQERQRQEQIRQQQTQQRRPVVRRQPVQQQQQRYQQPINQQQYQPRTNTQQPAPRQTNLRTAPNQQNPSALGKALGGIILAIGAAIWQGAQYVWECIVYIFSSIWSGIKYVFVSIAALLGFGAPANLDMPVIINTDEQLSRVEVKWEPVNHADYYVVHLDSIEKTLAYINPSNTYLNDDIDIYYSDRYIDTSNKEEDDIIVRDRSSIVLKRDDFCVKEYSIYACSDKSKYKPSKSQTVRVKQKYDNPFGSSIYSLDVIPGDIYVNNREKITSELDIKKPQKVKRFHSTYKTDYGNPSAPNIQAISIKDGAIVTWDDVDYVKYYELKVQIGKHGKMYGKNIHIDSEMHNYFFIFTNLYPDTEYFFHVVAIPYDDEYRYSSFSRTVSIKPDVN